MLIAISPDGSLQHTLDDLTFKMDVKPIGAERDVSRVSEILYDKQQDKYYVQFTMNPVKGAYLSWDEASNQYSLTFDTENYTLFEQYKDAVKGEVTFLDTLRRKGIVFTP